jgi:hypothetical protein
MGVSYFLAGRRSSSRANDVDEGRCLEASAGLFRAALGASAARLDDLDGPFRGGGAVGVASAVAGSPSTASRTRAKVEVVTLPPFPREDDAIDDAGISHRPGPLPLFRMHAYCQAVNLYVAEQADTGGSAAAAFAYSDDPVANLAVASSIAMFNLALGTCAGKRSPPPPPQAGVGVTHAPFSSFLSLLHFVSAQSTTLSG